MVPGKQGGFYFIVANFYGISGSSGNNKKFVNNERLLALALLRMLQFPNTPYFIVGDLNVDPTKSKVLANAVSKGVIHDIARQWTPHDGIIQPTFRREGVYKGMHGSGITRVDGILANTPGAHTVHSFEYVWHLAEGFDHVPLMITLNIEAFEQVQTELVKPKLFNNDLY